MATPLRIAKRDSIYAKKLGRFTQDEEQLEPKPQSSKKRDEYIQAVLSAQKSRSPQSSENALPVNFTIGGIPVSKPSLTSPVGSLHSAGRDESGPKSMLVTQSAKSPLLELITDLAVSEAKEEPLIEKMPHILPIKLQRLSLSRTSVSPLKMQSTREASFESGDTESVRTLIVTRSPSAKPGRRSTSRLSLSSLNRTGVSSRASLGMDSLDHRSILNNSLEGGEIENDENNMSIQSQSFASLASIGTKFARQALNRSMERRRLEAERLEEEKVAEVEEEISRRRFELESELQLLNEAKKPQPQFLALVEKNAQLEYRVENLRDGVDSIIAEKQRIKKDNVRAALAYYESKRMTERIREKMEKIQEQFEKKKQAAEQLVLRKFELDKVQDERINKSAGTDARSAGAGSAQKKSKVEAFREQEFLELVKKENAQLQKTLVELETAAMERAMKEFQRKAETAHSETLNESILMRDVCSRVKKSTETTIVVDESLML